MAGARRPGTSGGLEVVHELLHDPPLHERRGPGGLATQFWPDLAATLIGAFVSIWLALRGDHAREQRDRGVQEVALLRAAQDAVTANLTLCAQLNLMLGQNLTVPTFEMDVAPLDIILPRLVELSVDTALLAELNGFRYQLHHMNRKLDHMLELSRLPLTNLSATLTQIGGSILGSIAVVEGSGHRLPSLFDARLAALEAPRRPWWKKWGG